jgi:hypothetical protein
MDERNAVEINAACRWLRMMQRKNWMTLGTVVIRRQVYD